MDSKRIHLSVMGEQPAPLPAGDSHLAADAPLEERVVAVLKTIYDPEIPVDIHDLGLIYELKVDAAGAGAVQMQRTAPAWPGVVSRGGVGVEQSESGARADW